MNNASALLVVAALGGYVCLCRWLIRERVWGWEAAFALTNISLVFLFFFWQPDRIEHSIQVMLLYLLLVFGQYLSLSWWVERRGWISWLPFYVPIGVLVIFKIPSVQSAFNLIGLSYLAFRASYLVLEVRNRIVPKPGLWSYLGFAFFLPTMSVGPINHYAQHHLAFTEGEKSGIPVGRALLRVLVGAVKLRFLGPIFDQLTYGPLLSTGAQHSWGDFLIGGVAYYLYLYCNFSGLCDVAIGSAGLMGISVAENFNNPFAARNVQDYWNRWHITLSHYMRDVVFAPLSKSLVRLFGASNASHAVAFSIFVGNCSGRLI